MWGGKKAHGTISPGLSARGGALAKELRGKKRKKKETPGGPVGVVFRRGEAGKREIYRRGGFSRKRGPGDGEKVQVKDQGEVNNGRGRALHCPKLGGGGAKGGKEGDKKGLRMYSSKNLAGSYLDQSKPKTRAGGKESGEKRKSEKGKTQRVSGLSSESSLDVFEGGYGERGKLRGRGWKKCPRRGLYLLKV